MSRGRKLQVFLLTFAAGVLDGLCYLRGHVFAANMTGNVVLLGLDVVRNEQHRGGWNAIAIVAFAAGAWLAALRLITPESATGSPDEVKRGAMLEMPLLLAFGVFYAISNQDPSARAALIAVGACAMGIQSIAVRRLRISGVVTTFITGTITTAILEGVSGKDQGSSGGSTPLMLIAMLAVYLTAAAITALCARTIVAEFIPLACVAAVRLIST